MAEKKNHFLVQGSILAIASLLVRIIGVIYRIPIVRIIGLEGSGIYDTSFQVYNIALILSSYSLPLAVSRLVTVRRVRKEYRNSYRLFLCAMMIAVAAGFISTLVVFFGADVIANFFKNPSAALPLRVLAPTLFVFAIMGVFRGFYQGKNTMIPTAVSQVLEQIVNAIVSIVAAYILVKNYSASANVASYGAAGSTLGTFIGALIGLLFLSFVFVLYKPIMNKQMRHDITEHRESYGTLFKILLVTIGPIILSQTVYQISGIVDRSLFGNILVHKSISPFENEVLKALPGQLYTDRNMSKLWGIYSAEYRLLTNVPVAIAAAMAASVVTSITSDFTRGMVDSIRSKVYKAIKFNMIIAIPSAVGIGVLASQIIILLFPNGYSLLSVNVMMLGAISVVFFALSTITSAVLQGINKLRIPVINSAISLVIHIVLVLGLLQYTNLSTYALVIGNVTFPLVVCILNWLCIERYLHYHQEIIKTFVIPTVCAGLMGVAAYFSYYGLHKWTGSNALSTIVAILASIFVYFMLLIFLRGLNENELAGIPKGKSLVRVLKKLHII